MTGRLTRPALILTCLALAISACKKEPKGVQMPARQLVPPQADLVLGLDLDAVRASMLGAPLWAAVQAEADLGQILKAFQDCRPQQGGLRLLGATRVATEGEEFVIVLEGKDIGHKDLLRCLDKKIAEANGERSLVLFSTHGDVATAPQADGGCIILLNHDTLAAVTKGWKQSVFAIIDSHEKPAQPQGVSTALSKALLESDLWVAFRLGTIPELDLKEYPVLEGLKDVAMSFELSQGLAMKADLTFDDKAKAANFQAGTQLMLAEVKAEAQADGEALPPAEAAEKQLFLKLVDSLKLSPAPGDDAKVRAELSIGMQMLQQLATLAQADL